MKDSFKIRNPCLLQTCPENLLLYDVAKKAHNIYSVYIDMGRSHSYLVSSVTKRGVWWWPPPYSSRHFFVACLPFLTTTITAWNFKGVKWDWNYFKIVINDSIFSFWRSWMLQWWCEKYLLDFTSLIQLFYNDFFFVCR